MHRRRLRPEDRQHRDDAGSEAAVRSAAVALLTRRDFASGELRAKLQSQGFQSATVLGVIEQLVSSRLVDDARFTERFVTYHAARGHGPVRIRQLLQALELSGEAVELAIEAGGDWPALASEARRRKFGAPGPATWKERGRQMRFLQYRGFSNDHIHAALGKTAIDDGDPSYHQPDP